MYKIRTIDVWDTLLRRDCHPECIKLTTAHHLLFGWHAQIKSEFRDIWVLYRARLEAERTLAVQVKAGGKDDEYEITEVLAQWFSAIFVDTMPPDLPNRLAEFELSVEVDRSFADSDIVEFLRIHEAEKTLFLSDFYMSGEMLRRLLSAKGLNTLVEEGLSSCDVGLNKRSGQIFRHVHSIHAISPQEHVHIGDNEWSDVSSPRALGVHALHYLPESAHAERLAREHLFSSRETLFNHVSGECTALIQNASKGRAAKQASALSLGIQAAPLFIGFALWIAEQAILQKLDRLYFFTREGEFFHKVYCAINPLGLLSGHPLPPSEILEVSRLSTFASSMKEASIKEMTRIWSTFKMQSVSGLFITLGLDIEKFSELLKTLNLHQTEIITDPLNCPRLRLLFETPSFTQALMNSLTYQRSMLQRYLKQSGVDKYDRIGIIDIGWRGSIQDNIALLIPDTHIYGMYLGLHRFINEQPFNATKAAYSFDSNIFSNPSVIFNNFDLMELLCNSPNGSVVGYILDNERIIPNRNIEMEEAKLHGDFVEQFQEGVLIAAKQWQVYIESYVVSSNELQELSLHVWKYLNSATDQSLMDTYLQTPQQDLFGFGEVFKRNKFPSLSTIFLSPILATRRRHLIDYILRVQWVEAVENAKDIGLFHRSILLTIYLIANMARRIKKRIKIY